LGDGVACVAGHEQDAVDMATGEVAQGPPPLGLGAGNHEDEGEVAVGEGIDRAAEQDGEVGVLE
jgi:hypothetical protein